jgi:3-hydroxyacyl-CoA dehydrogenase
VEQCVQANEYITQNVAAYARKTNKTPGKFETTSSLAQAVENAWLVIECVPEKLEAKTKIFGELAALARRDAILATNSSSYRSSEMLGEVPEDCKNRILNMHYYMPPSCMVVELMTDGFIARGGNSAVCGEDRIDGLHLQSPVGCREAGDFDDSG